MILEYWDHCDYHSINDAVSDVDEVRWYPREINFFSLEESLTEVIKGHDEFKKKWEQGKIDEWTRNYYGEKAIDPTTAPMSIEFLSVGMCASNNEPMGFDVGRCTMDCELFNDGEQGEQRDFVDYLRWKLLGENLLCGECITNNPLKYIYTGCPPEFEKMNAEIKNGIIMF